MENLILWMENEFQNKQNFQKKFSKKIFKKNFQKKFSKKIFKKNLELLKKFGKSDFSRIWY